MSGEEKLTWFNDYGRFSGHNHLIHIRISLRFHDRSMLHGVLINLQQFFC
jgi:hypothetical protein